jgi:hypothetical protein
MLLKPYQEEKMYRLYGESVGDAAKPQPWEITRDLITIKADAPYLIWKQIRGEPHLLVSSWKYDTTYYKNAEKTGTYNTGQYPIWVTTAPELRQICGNKQFGRKEGLDLRLKQLLGLPPSVEKNYFVEFWVRPQDLFRPCLDSEVSEANCTLAFPEDESADHKQWINDLRIASYYNAEWDKNYPWTQLCYTYDWHPRNKDHVGVSEFVIGENKEVVVNRIFTTEEYCKVVNK